MAVPLSYMVSHLFPYPKPKAPQSQITVFQSVVTENGQVVGGVPFVKMRDLI